MAINPLPPAPSRGDPTTFAAKGDALMAALPGFVEEANALQTDVNAKQATASSAATTAVAAAGSAGDSASLAGTKAGEAFDSAAAALASKNAAGVSAGNAADSETAAAASAATVDAKNLSTNYFGDVEPAITWPGMRWAHESAGLLKVRNAADDGWVPEDYLFMSMNDQQWASMPLAIPFPLWDHLAGCPTPPTSNPHFRFIKLTASSAYNTGVLTGETVSGTGPLLIATATISLTDSPINGTSIHLINTELRFLRASTASGAHNFDTFQDHAHVAGYSSSPSGGSGAVITSNVSPGNTGAVTLGATTFSGGGAVRQGTETAPKHIGATYYMKIKG